MWEISAFVFRFEARDEHIPITVESRLIANCNDVHDWYFSSRYNCADDAMRGSVREVRAGVITTGSYVP